MLAIAAYEDSVDAARKVPYLRKWVDDWNPPQDLGYLAWAEDRNVGAVWTRQFDADEPDLPIYIDPYTPELAIACRPEFQGRGIGTKLISTICQRARKRGWNGLCLTVREGNPAIALYRRIGFMRLKEFDRRNRTGSLSLGMHLAFDRPTNR